MKTQLRLKIGNTDNGTQIAEQFYTSPLKLGFPNSYGKRKKVVLMMASAGVLKGDCFDYKIQMREDSCALVTEQSYTKLFDMGNDGQARKQVEITVERGASLYYKPCALIPFKNSCMIAETEVYLDREAEFACCDIFSAGRVAMGEAFAFRKYQNQMRIYVDQVLVWNDHCKLEPQKMDYTNLIYFGKYSHQGNFYYYGPNDKMAELMEHARKMEIDFQDIYWGITEAKKGICVRALANSAQDLEELFAKLATETGMEIV